MFGVDFYPTPKALIEQMCSDLELEGKQVLEPSAGSGNIVDYCVGSGAIVSAVRGLCVRQGLEAQKIN